jgi:hypothetical protein
VELRIEAGETLALLYELAREEDEVDTVCDFVLKCLVCYTSVVREYNAETGV